VRINAAAGERAGVPPIRGNQALGALGPGRGDADETGRAVCRGFDVAREVVMQRRADGENECVQADGDRGRAGKRAPGLRAHRHLSFDYTQLGGAPLRPAWSGGGPPGLDRAGARLGTTWFAPDAVAYAAPKCSSVVRSVTVGTKNQSA
jgi:hypothetical protein